MTGQTSDISVRQKRDVDVNDVTRDASNDVTSDESDATQSVSDIFAKISRDKRKPEKPGRLPFNRNLLQ